MKSTYYLNGEYIEASKALISVDDRGFQFSDGIYEVIWICDSSPIDIGDHFLRLKSSLKEISTMRFSALANINVKRRKYMVIIWLIFPIILFVKKYRFLQRETNSNNVINCIR